MLLTATKLDAKPFVKPNYCKFGCKCPSCGAYMEIEAVTLAHYCHLCERYQLPVEHCPLWGRDGTH